ILDKETSLQEACALLWKHPQVCAEVREILPILAGRKSHLHIALPSHPEIPLQIHSRYTRIEILSGLGIGGPAQSASSQTGVKWAPRTRADLLAFTLDKTTGSFSPTTRYKDYAITRELIHWESQSTTRADSKTGKRYQNHESLGTTVLLFTRLHRGDRAF